MSYLKILLFSVPFTAFIWCCSEDGIEKTVQNAHISCQSNVSCKAECYRGYILSNGETETTFNCQNSSWPSTSMACKRIPVVAISYFTVWMLDVLPEYCNSISQHLEDSKQILEEQFIYICSSFNIGTGVNFTFSPRAFELTTTFNTEYENATSVYNIDLCIAYTKISFWNMQFIRNMLDNITCNGSKLNYEPHVKFNTSEERKICQQNTVIQTVTVSDVDNILRRRELYCDSSTTTNLIITEQYKETRTSVLTSEFTSMTTLTNEPPSKLSSVCLEMTQILFITIPAAVILTLVTATITALVSRKANTKNPTEIDSDDVMLQQIQPTGIEMKDIIQRGSNSHIRSKLIENDLYQMASGVDNCTYSGINDVRMSATYSTVVRDTAEASEGHLPYSVENEDMGRMPEEYLYSQVQKSKME